MKSIKTLMMVLNMILLTASPTFAGLSLSIVIDSPSPLTNIQQTASNVRIGQITINNSSGKSFSISISSAKNGKLIRNGTTGSNTADYIAYTITFTPSANWNYTTSANLIRVSLSTTPYVILFYQPTFGSKQTNVYLELDYSSSSKTLFAGAYSDALTVTIANI
jgi:hypothetical protein